MKPSFDVYVDRAGYHRWRLVAGNGEIIAVSEAYVSRYNAIRSVNNVKMLASRAEIR